jgi:transcriptional regulator with XRE-family HTH domain
MLKDRINKARKDSHFTQAGLASRIGASERSIKRWEKGDGEPSPRFLRAIMRETGKPPEFFYPDDDEEAALLAIDLHDVLNRLARFHARLAAHEESVA